MKPSQKTPPKSAKSLSIGKVIAIIIVAFMLFGSVVAIKTMRDNHQKDLQAEQVLVVDKATFAQAEADMDKAYAEIVAVIGEPEVEGKTKECSRQSRKLESGQLKCYITSSFAYYDETANDSILRTIKVRDLLNTNPLFLNERADFIPKLDLTSNTPQGSSMNVEYTNSLHCSLLYRYADYASDTLKLNRIVREHRTAYQFSCSKDVGLEVYPETQPQ